MTIGQKEERTFVGGYYICPMTQTEQALQTDVPRPYVSWPVRVNCKACGSEHLLGYEDVRAADPAFGHE